MKANTVKSQIQAKQSGGKRIDLGAASQFGKDLGINSPTHRNSHSEDLFSVENNNTTTTTTTSSNNVIDELDDFNPRAEENQEFGDFTTAFGAGDKSTKVATKGNKEEIDEFADFTSAFTGGVQPSAAATRPSADLLFGDIPAPPSAVVNNATNQPDLFSTLGGLGQTNILSTNSGNADLLSDFKGISLGGPQINGELMTFYPFALFPFDPPVSTLN